MTDLAPGRSAGGRGGGRLPESVELAIREVIRKVYLTKQKPPLAVVHREIARECKAQGLAAPARNTVALRIEALYPVKAKRSREGREAVRTLQSTARDRQQRSFAVEAINAHGDGREGRRGRYPR